MTLWMTSKCNRLMLGACTVVEKTGKWQKLAAFQEKQGLWEGIENHGI